VTVATNIAGRGVDIILGGNPQDKHEAEGVKDLGGLHVIGTERHEARRIDNQLRGRSGRQGDSGSSQFFVSVEDDVIRIFGGDRVSGLMDTLGLPEDMPITHSLVSKAIESAQSKIEAHNFDIRRYILEFDDVMNKQRQYAYRLRREILEEAAQNSEKLKERVQEYIKTQAQKLTETQSNRPEGELIELLTNWLGDYEWERKLQEFSKSGQPAPTDWLAGELLKIYAQKENELKPENLRQAEKTLLLQIIDTLWIEHIANMEHLRDSVGLRAYGQRDPLVEYKKEGLKLFKQLREAIPALFVTNIFRVQGTGFRGQGKTATQAALNPKPLTPTPRKKIGRNDPCPCGSGKKYKKCHGK